jgi:hypothetical protein
MEIDFGESRINEKLQNVQYHKHRNLMQSNLSSAAQGKEQSPIYLTGSDPTSPVPLIGSILNPVCCVRCHEDFLRIVELRLLCGDGLLHHCFEIVEGDHPVSIGVG